MLFLSYKWSPIPTPHILRELAFSWRKCIGNPVKKAPRSSVLLPSADSKVSGCEVMNVLFSEIERR